MIPLLDLPDDDDRHVLAAAIVGGADTIITFNLKGFPAQELAKYDIEAQHPDDFIIHQLSLSQATVCAAAKRHRAALKKPPKSTEDYLTTLESQGLPQTVASLRGFSELL